MDASIITIGDEILIGQIVDTNSTYIAGKLNSIGIRCNEILSISDNKEHIISALNRVVAPGKVVTITGGLGPTNDDITKNVLAEYTGSKNMVVHEEQLSIVEDIATRRNLPMNTLNRKQADVPDTCEVLLNYMGTAPGMWFEYKDAVIIALPGVPFEMKALLDEVLERLKKRFQLHPIYHRSLMTFGMPESMLAECLAPWENALPSYIKLAYLPNPTTGVKLRLSVYDTPLPLVHKSAEEQHDGILKEIEKQITALHDVLGDALYGEEPDTLQTMIGTLLKEKKATMATAESCTGGRMASLITSIPGSSAYFKGSIVAYDNSVKTDVLGVDPKAIQEYGAVSLQVVEQMAVGARRVLKADYAVATSGVAGPDGGTPGKPVGTVCFAVATPTGVFSHRLLFTNDRQRNIERSAAAALNMMRIALIRRS
jgi:nicotinamide-nucleotide amidase